MIEELQWHPHQIISLLIMTVFRIIIKLAHWFHTQTHKSPTTLSFSETTMIVKIFSPHQQSHVIIKCTGIHNQITSDIRSHTEIIPNTYTQKQQQTRRHPVAS